MRTQADNAHHTPSWLHIAGFACLQVFLLSAFYMGSNRQIVLGSSAIERADLVFMLLFMLVAFAIERAWPHAGAGLFESQPLIVACGVLLAAGAALVATTDGSAAGLLAVEGAVIGMPLACLLMAWGHALGTGTPRVASYEIFGAMGLAGACCFLMSFLPSVACAVVQAACALASAALLVATIGRPHDAAQDIPHANTNAAGAHDEALKPARARILSVRMLAGAALFGLAAGLVEAYRSEPGSPSAPAIAATMFIVALFCVAVLQSLHKRFPDERDAFVTMYRIAMLVIMSGFLFMPVLEGTSVPGDAVVLAGYLGLIASFTALFLATSDVARIEPAEAFAQGFGALYAGEAIGVVCASAANAASPLSATPYIVAALAGLSVLIAYLFLFTERDFRELSCVVDEPDSVADVCAELASRAKLSQRETEVLALALRGRTSERIAAELTVAKSTADTHLRRIYAKCGVHGRQELLDLGEEVAEEMGRAAHGKRR